MVREPPSGLQAKLRAPLLFGILGWSSCSIYNASLLDDARGGTGGTAPSGGSDDGGMSAAAGSGTGGDPTGGDGGSTQGGAAGRSGGSGGPSGGRAGSAGSNGGAGVSGSNAAGKSSAGAAGSGATGAAAGSDAGGEAGSGGEAGAPDCMTLGDCCPTDDAKTEPGVCGCDVADTDTDEDGTADCLDECPLDEGKVAPGACGCGLAGNEADCEELKGALIHRYEFSGTGTTVTDSKGSADGVVLGTGASLSDGKLKLAGGVAPSSDANKQYVELPEGCLADLSDATFEVWVEWSTTCAPTPCTDSLSWQRIFDFGEAATTSSGSYLFLTPRTATNSASRTALTTAGANAEMSTGFVVNGAMLSAGSYHFAVVVDATAGDASLYLDGEPAGSAAIAGSLASIDDENCWLGRSQYAADPYLNGTYDEFRVYAAALSASAIAQSFAAGPDATFF